MSITKKEGEPECLGDMAGGEECMECDHAEKCEEIGMERFANEMMKQMGWI